MTRPSTAPGRRSRDERSGRGWANACRSSRRRQAREARGSAVAEAVVRGRDASPSEDDLQDPKYHLDHHADRGSAEPLIEPPDDDLVVVVVRLDPVSESTIRLTDLRHILEFTLEEDASPKSEDQSRLWQKDVDP